MLLCTGSFFGTSEESEKEWETYMSGSSSGGALYSFHYVAMQYTATLMYT